MLTSFETKLLDSAAEGPASVREALMGFLEGQDQQDRVYCLRGLSMALGGALVGSRRLRALSLALHVIHEMEDEYASAPTS